MYRRTLMLQQLLSIPGGAIAGALIYLILDSIFFRLDLFGGIMFTIIAAYVGVFIGSTIVGYIFLKKIAKLQHFLISLILSFLGLSLSVGFFFLVIYGAIHSLIIAYTFLIILPPLMIIGGFQIGIGNDL